MRKIRSIILVYVSFGSIKFCRQLVVQGVRLERWGVRSLGKPKVRFAPSEYYYILIFGICQAFFEKIANKCQNN